MSLVPLFQAIQTQLQTNVGNAYPFGIPTNAKAQIAYIRMWNNQLADWTSEDEKKNNMYSVQFPCLLIEFDNVSMEQMGNGAQMYKDLLIKIHIIHKEIESTVKGDHEQNLRVYALADSVFAALSLYKTNGAGTFVRISHTLDSKHGNLYHFISEWKTNWIDLQQLGPVGGQTVATVTPVITESYNPKPYIK